MVQIEFETDIMRWVEASRWIITPKQERSRATLARIVSSAMRLFVEKGFDDTTLSDISEKSGVAMGSIYKRFPSKNSILNTIVDGYRNIRVREIATFLNAQVNEMSSAAEVLAMHIEIMFTSFRSDRGILRLMESRRLVDDVASQVLSDANREVVDLIATVMLSHLSGRVEAEFRRDLFYVHNIVRGSLVWSVLPARIDREGSLDPDDPEYMTRAISLSRLYLAV